MAGPTLDKSTEFWTKVNVYRVLKREKKNIIPLSDPMTRTRDLTLSSKVPASTLSSRFKHCPSRCTEAPASTNPLSFAMPLMQLPCMNLAATESLSERISLWSYPSLKVFRFFSMTLHCCGEDSFLNVGRVWDQI